MRERAALLDAIEHAAGELPHYMEIVLEVEEGSAVVRLRNWNLDQTVDTGPVDGDESLAECIERQIDRAKALSP